MAQDNAQPFRSMAERIDRNPPSEFAGALLIVPPQGGEPIELLLVDPKRDIASFWGAVQGKIAVAVAELQEQQNSGFAIRR